MGSSLFPDAKTPAEPPIKVANTKMMLKHRINCFFVMIKHFINLTSILKYEAVPVRY